MNAPAPKAPPRFKIRKNITLPTISMKENEVRFLKFMEPIYVGKKVEPKPGDKEKAKEPPHLVNVTDMESGELGTLIMNTVLVSTIEEAYPERSYVGKLFRIQKLPKKAGKDYHAFQIQEVEADYEEPGDHDQTRLGAGVVNKKK